MLCYIYTDANARTDVITNAVLIVTLILEYRFCHSNASANIDANANVTIATLQSEMHYAIAHA